MPSARRRPGAAPVAPARTPLEHILEPLPPHVERERPEIPPRGPQGAATAPVTQPAPAALVILDDAEAERASEG